VAIIGVNQISKVDPGNTLQLRRRTSDTIDAVNNLIGQVASNTSSIAANQASTQKSVTALQDQVNALPITKGGHVVTVNTTPTSVTFPSAFPNACTAVVATDDKAGGNARIMSVLSISASGFTIEADGTGNGAYWIATGN